MDTIKNFAYRPKYIIRDVGVIAGIED